MVVKSRRLIQFSSSCIAKVQLSLVFNNFTFLVLYFSRILYMASFALDEIVRFSLIVI